MRTIVGPAAPSGLAPAIVFGPGRAETATHVRFEAFDGPLALLLALIEARQLDVLNVPLGALAEAYLDALAALEGDRLASVSSFVAVAAQLILIKSRALLPRAPSNAASALDDEPDPEAELRARLLEYRRYRDAGFALRARFEANRGLFRRDGEAAIRAGQAGARPPERPPMPPAALVRALRGLVRLTPPERPVEAVMTRTVTLAERTAIIRAALREADAIVLQDLLGGVRDRVVVAITFLALLELAKRREVSLEQAEPWGPIVARRLAATALPEETATATESET